MFLFFSGYSLLLSVFDSVVCPQAKSFSKIQNFTRITESFTQWL